MRVLLIPALVLFLATCGGSQDDSGPDGIQFEVLLATCQTLADCDDGDGCTVDNCVGGRCVNLPRSCDDKNPCTEDRCEAGQCINEAAEGCCVGDADCDDGNFCTKDTCVNGVCAHGDPLPDCCNNDADCDDDDDCTKNLCNDLHRCNFDTKDPAAGCCTQPKDCHDSDYCTTDECIDGRCVNKRDPGCCQYDEDCEDADPCTRGVCDFSECAYTPVVDCCNEDTDCPVVACTTATCLDNACVHTPLQNCCTVDQDCGDPCLVCDIPAGVDEGGCVLKGTPECCTTTVLDIVFSDLGGFVISSLAAPVYAEAPSWNLDGLRTVSAPTALYFGDPATHRLYPLTLEDGKRVGGRATRAGVDLGSTTNPVLSFQVYRSGSIVSSVDVLSVIVVDGGTEAVVWSTANQAVGAGAFELVSIGLSAFAGRVVSLVLEFDSRSDFATDYEGVWVDDLKVSGQCL